MSDLPRQRDMEAAGADRREPTPPPLREARDDLHATASAIGAQATETKDRIGEQAASVLDEAKAKGSEVADAAQERVESLAEQGKAAGAERAQGLAQAVRHAADDLEASSPEIARHVRAAADSVEGVAAALRERSVGDLLSEVGNFARRQPTAFFGTALVAGFAISRFAKSSAPHGTGHAAQRPTGLGMSGGPGGRTGSMESPTPAHTTATGAPGWVPDAAGAAQSHPATMAAASLGGAVAHRAGDAAPGSMPTDRDVAVIPPIPGEATTPGLSRGPSPSGDMGRTS